MSQNDLISKLENLQELRRMAEELAAEIDAAQDEIKAHMTDNALTDLTAGPFKVTWHYYGTSRIDAKALAADHPELAAQYTRNTSGRRFMVK